MSFFGRIFRGNKGFAASSNALLAEYMLPELSADTKDQMRSQIAHIFRAGGFPNISDDFIYTKFNSSPRQVQLNLIAIALNDLGIEPSLKGEFWHEVRNPFRPDIYDPVEMEAVQARLAHQHKMQFQISSEPLHFMDL
jgi:hypothetical protein